MTPVPTLSFVQRASALGLAALVTLSLLNGMSHIADLQVDSSLLAQREPSCPVLASTTPAPRS